MGDNDVKQTKFCDEQTFMKKRVLSTDAAWLLRELLKTRQNMKYLHSRVQEPEVAEMIADYIDYIDCEVKFLHNITSENFKGK